MRQFRLGIGPVDAISPMDLLLKGSLYLTAPSLTQYLAKREDVVANAGELFDVIASGAVKVRIHDTLPLAEVAEAHRQLEGRKVTGAIILHP